MYLVGLVAADRGTFSSAIFRWRKNADRALSVQKSDIVLLHDVSLSLFGFFRFALQPMTY